METVKKGLNCNFIPKPIQDPIPQIGSFESVLSKLGEEIANSINEQKEKSIKSKLIENGFNFSQKELKERVMVISNPSGKCLVFVDYNKPTEKLITWWFESIYTEFKNGRIIFIYGT